VGLTPQSQPDPAFWRGRRVLVTGHTGFKGAWLVYWLSKMGAYVAGLALAPSTRPSLFDLLELKRRCEHHEGDIRNAALVQRVINEFRPEVVMHLAAQALVRESYHTPVETFASNVMGTVHVLDAIRRMDDTRVAVMVTTDKVYRNREWVWPYREDDPLGGRDPYSASKPPVRWRSIAGANPFLPTVVLQLQAPELATSLVAETGHPIACFPTR
jgi:CDP-glucose 4,6-dehydratase